MGSPGKNRIFLDFEMNTVNKRYGEVREKCNCEIIEIGAVKLDERNTEVDRFQCYVQPVYNDHIAPHIKKLTGITTDQVKDAPGFEDAVIQFLCWCADDYEIYSWSENDLNQLRKEYDLKVAVDLPETEYMFSHWNDLQVMYGDQFHFTRPTALSQAVNVAGLDFAGRAHTALADAAATADLYREMEDGTTIKKIADDLNEAGKSIGTSLGELFTKIAV